MGPVTYERIFNAYDGDFASYTIELSRIYLQKREDDEHDGLVWAMYGDSLRKVGLFNEAQEALAKALCFLSSEQLHLFYGIEGWFHRSQGNYERAASSFKKAAELKPQMGSYLVLQGDMLLKLGRIDAAGKWFKQALMRDVDADEVYANLAHIAQMKGYYEVARDYLMKSLEIDPTSQKLKNRLRDIELTCELLRVDGNYLGNNDSESSQDIL